MDSPTQVLLHWHHMYCFRVTAAAAVGVDCLLPTGMFVRTRTRSSNALPGNSQPQT